MHAHICEHIHLNHVLASTVERDHISPSFYSLRQFGNSSLHFHSVRIILPWVRRGHQSTPVEQVFCCPPVARGWMVLSKRCSCIICWCRTFRPPLVFLGKHFVTVLELGKAYSHIFELLLPICLLMQVEPSVLETEKLYERSTYVQH